MGLGWVPNPKAGTLLREEETDTGRQRRCAAGGRDWSYAATSQRSQEPWEAARGKESLEPSEGTQPCWHLDFGFLDASELRESTEVCTHLFSNSFLITLGSQAKVIRNEDSRRLAFPAWFPGFYPASSGATPSNILAWRIPWTVLSMGSQRVRHGWGKRASLSYQGSKNKVYLMIVCHYL